MCVSAKSPRDYFGHARVVTLKIMVTSGVSLQFVWVFRVYLFVVQTFGDCSEGLANSIIFVLFSPKLRRRLKQTILTCFYRLCMRCLWRTRTQQVQVDQDGEQDKLLRGTIRATYAQRSTSLDQSDPPARTQSSQDGPVAVGGSAGSSRTYSSMSSTTERRSYAI